MNNDNTKYTIKCHYIHYGDEGMVKGEGNQKATYMCKEAVLVLMEYVDGHTDTIYKRETKKEV